MVFVIMYMIGIDQWICIAFGLIAASWRGKNILQRNAIIALANANDRTAVAKLLEIIDKGQNPIHAATALWSLGELVKQPTADLVRFIEGIDSQDDNVLTEKRNLLNKWQF